MCTIRIVSTKWDGSPHRDSVAIELGDDVHGRWFWMGEDTPVITAAGAYLARPGLRLFPHDAWWSAYFVPAHGPSGRLRQWYVDIGSPATQAGQVLSFVDLDLDVERLGEDGPVTLLDQDEFDANRIAMAYPDDVVDTAKQVAEQMFRWMSSGAEPFDVVSSLWLDRAPAPEAWNRLMLATSGARHTTTRQHRRPLPGS